MPPGLLFVTLQLLTALLRRDGGMVRPVAPNIAIHFFPGVPPRSWIPVALKIYTISILKT